MSDILSIDIRFVCCECQSRLRIDAAAAGRRAACTRCGRVIQIPSLPSHDSAASGILSFELRFACQECQAKNRIDVAAAGAWVHCTTCGKKTRVPDAPAWARRVEDTPPPTAAPAAEIPSPAARRGVLTDEEIAFMMRDAGE